jgi:hypothetical protein
MNSSNLNLNNNQIFHNTNRLTPNDSMNNNNYYGLLDQPTSPLYNNQTQFMNFNLNSYPVIL